MRQSRQRDVVLDVVRASHEHPTVDAIFRLARRRMPRIGLGTVYRNLHALVGEGLLRAVPGDQGAVRYDGNLTEHYHLRCVRCGDLQDLALPIDRRVEDAARRVSDYRILGHELDVRGVCPRCEPPVDAPSVARSRFSRG